MTDVATTAAVCVATGAVSTTFCAAFGFDPTLLLGGLVGGFIGCLIVQTLIPSKTQPPFGSILALMVGSVLFSAVATMLVSPMLIRTLALQDVPPGAVRLSIGALIGGLAQPIVIMGKRKFLKFWEGFGNKENGNA